MRITIEHFRRAVEAAKAGGCTIGGTDYTYNQSTWECKTACCVWGFVAHSAGIPVGNGPTNEAKAIAPLACSLMRVTDPCVLPLIDAAVNSGDVEAAAMAARSNALNIWVGGTLEKMNGGEAWLYGNATLTTMTGGEAWLDGNATLTTMTGGTAWLDGPDAKVVNHLGGTVIRNEWRGGVWVEVSRVTKEVTA